MRFLEVVNTWINRYFSNEEAIYLIALVAVGLLVLLLLGDVLAPVLAGLVLAFLLQGLVDQMIRWRVPAPAAVYLTFLLFLGGLVAMVLFLGPLFWQQLKGLATTLPDLIARLPEVVRDLSASFPGVVSATQVSGWFEGAAGQLGNLSATALQGLVTNVPSLVALFLYLVLVPITVFFFLKDGARLRTWFRGLLPANRSLIDRVGDEMNLQLANYVRGKFIEILIVGFVTFVTFSLLGLNYSLLLAVLVGVSVLIPFVGAAVVTIPVLLVALIQFGWSWELAYVMGAYGVIQALDGNVLVPLLFSEAVDLHPIAIIVAVLVFGGLWGVWGVFFAIPLATLVRAIYNAWPREVASAKPFEEA